MNLNLGCADDIRAGYVNVDLFPYEGIDIIEDLSAPDWIWSTSTIDEILAFDIIEHLPNKINTMNECWRILKPGGVLNIVVPTTNGTGAFQDPTHVSYWNRRSFLYYEYGNIYRDRFAAAYGIKAAFRVIAERMDLTPDGEKLSIQLEAVK